MLTGGLHLSLKILRLIIHFKEENIKKLFRLRNAFTFFSLKLILKIMLKKFIELSNASFSFTSSRAKENIFKKKCT